MNYTIPPGFSKIAEDMKNTGVTHWFMSGRSSMQLGAELPKWYYNKYIFWPTYTKDTRPTVLHTIAEHIRPSYQAPILRTLVPRIGYSVHVSSSRIEHVRALNLLPSTPLRHIARLKLPTFNQPFVYRQPRLSSLDGQEALCLYLFSCHLSVKPYFHERDTISLE